MTTRAFNETWRTMDERKTSMRLAAYGLAVRRVADATITRGLYPYAGGRSLQGSGMPSLRARRGGARGSWGGARVRARAGRDRRWFRAPGTPPPAHSGP